jgi:alkylmercury lyase
MTDDSTDLVARLAAPDETGLDPTILVPLLGLRASGDPAEVTTLAATAGRTVAQTRAQLAKLPAARREF